MLMHGDTITNILSMNMDGMLPVGQMRKKILVFPGLQTVLKSRTYSRMLGMSVGM